MDNHQPPLTPSQSDFILSMWYEATSLPTIINVMIREPKLLNKAVVVHLRHWLGKSIIHDPSA